MKWRVKIGENDNPDFAVSHCGRFTVCLYKRARQYGAFRTATRRDSADRLLGMHDSSIEAQRACEAAAALEDGEE